MQLVLIETLLSWTIFKSKQNFEKNRNVHVGYVDLLLQGFAICTF